MLMSQITCHTFICFLIGIVLFSFPNNTIIYPLGPVYYFPGHPSNTISLGALKFYVGFQKVASEPPENCDLVLEITLPDSK